MTYGSLFTGIGGLDLALEAFGHTPVWQAECDPYARAVLAKHWPGVRCYNDVREIDHEAPPPDILCGGFPCQDISNAGKRVGIDGERSGLWSEFARIIRVLRPRFVFVENVAALTVRGLDRVLGDLATLGFDAEWDVLRAADVGAPHLRARIFILAYANGEHGRIQPERRDGARWSDSTVAADDGAEGYVADSRQGGLRAGLVDLCPWQPDADGRGEGAALADTDCSGRGIVGGSVLFDGERSARRGDLDRRHRPHLFPPGLAAIAGWDGPQPAIRRGDDGVPGRSHRLRLLGNAVVWQQAALAIETLTDRARRVSTEAA